MKMRITTIVLLITISVAMSSISTTCNGQHHDKRGETIAKQLIGEQKGKYTLTKSGVDIVQLNELVVPTPKPDAVYDEIRYDEYGYPELYRNGRKVAMLGDIPGTPIIPSRIIVCDPDIVSENSIHVGMTMREFLSIPGSYATLEWIGIDMDCLTPFLSLGNSDFVVCNSKPFSKRGLKKWNKFINSALQLIKQGKSDQIGGWIELKASDFQKGDTI